MILAKFLSFCLFSWFTYLLISQTCFLLLPFWVISLYLLIIFLKNLDERVKTCTFI